MKLIDRLHCAVLAQRTYVLRSSLALVGVAAGVATVLLAIAAAAGARDRAMRELGALGPDAIVVRPSATPSETVRAHFLTTRLADAIGHTIADARVASLRHGSEEVRLGTQSIQVNLLGASSDWPRVSGATLSRGRWIDEDDERSGRRVVVLGDSIAQHVAGENEIAGEWVRVGVEWFRVVGVLARRGTPDQSAMVSAIDLDRAAVVPLHALPPPAAGCFDCVDEVVIKGKGRPREIAAVTRHVAAQIAPAIDARSPGYSIVVAEELLQARLAARRTADALLAVIGALALAIGGIGIANILLAHVSERTMEIGVRRALGATRRAIISQIALEAVLLCGAGAFAGLFAGVAAAVLAARFGGWDVLITPLAVFASLISALGVGLLAGLLPAYRAGALTPAAALREE